MSRQAWGITRSLIHWIETGTRVENVHEGPWAFVIDDSDESGGLRASVVGLALIGKLGLERARKVVEQCADAVNTDGVIAASLGVEPFLVQRLEEAHLDGESVATIVRRLRDGEFVEEATKRRPKLSPSWR